MPVARHIDALVAEIGSTTTVVSAFDGLTDEGETPRLLGQGVAPTSVLQGDVGVGVAAARAQLEAATGPLDSGITVATSSAAGGLRMTVHGLTQKMTAMAAREAALGAGGVVEYMTAGRLRDADLGRIDQVAPSLILLAGGVEGGDTDTVLYNAERLAGLKSRPIVVYAGNSLVADEARELLEAAGFRVRITANVYPGIDELEIVPARAVIHDAFEEHITHAPGMERIGEFVTGRILPTPGAVLIAAELLAEAVGDLVVVDVGGATTDVHSVTDGSPEMAAIATEPEPHSKRTVEGDLGVFVSASHVAALLPEGERPATLPPAIPSTPEQIAAAALLTRTAAVAGVQRHAGELLQLYTPRGRQTVARGRDLTACRLLVGTGGALTRLPGGEAMLEATRTGATGSERLLPPADSRCVLDHDYLLAACGALSTHFPADKVVALMRASCGL
ncbi:MAG: glutamate mutase L [Coriobacteriia bacterium]|nr:glutamate mutase L [Coriobacteriia bacterium]